MNKKGGKGKPEPIAGAEVKFVPEGFLGPGLTTGTGTTDKRGHGHDFAAQPRWRRSGRGHEPGFYRVEITKGNEIPAKYNTATILGEEVACDAVRLWSGPLNFELEY